MRLLILIAALMLSACATVPHTVPWYERAETVQPAQLELQP